MRDKIYSIMLSALFITLMIWCPLMFGLAESNIISLPANKNVKLPEKVYESGEFLAPVLNSIEKGKANLENIYSNCLPMYENITVFMLNNERAMRETLLETLYSLESPEPVAVNVIETVADNTDSEIQDIYEEPTEPEIPKIEYMAKRIGADSLNVYWAFTEVGKPYSEGWTDKTLVAGEDELWKRLERQLGHVTRIANADLNVNFYVYVCLRFQETETFAEIIKDIRPMRGETSTKHFLEAFFEGLDNIPAINAYDYFKIDTLEKRLEYIFKTDHHESPRGAYSIYRDVITMMAKDSPEIGEPYEAEFKKVPGIEYRGSHVWGHGYTEIYDEFEYYIVDLPPHDMFESLNGRRKTQSALEAYESRRFGRDTFYDHYANFFPRPQNIVYPENNIGRNLLMLADSYAWGFSELISAHFDNTYIVPWTHGTFEYNKFIREKNITDVIIIQYSGRILFNTYNDTQLERVIIE